MKANLFLIPFLAAVMLLASCKKDNGTETAIAEEGKATSMTVSVNFPQGLATRAADPNATEAETQLNTVDVFIYITATGALQWHESLDADDFDSSIPNEYESVVRIPTTTGAKTVFAGVNLPASVVSALEDQSMSAISNIAQTITREDLTGASNSNFAMFSIAPVNSTFVLDPGASANSVQLECRRLVAKVTVETAEDMTVTGIDGELGQLEFAVNNFNTKVFLMQGAGEVRTDPNWVEASYTTADFIAATNTDYAPVLYRSDIPNPTVNDYSARYAAENTSRGKRRKEITRVTVRATFIPDRITTGTTGDFTEVDNSVVTPESFWTVTPTIGATAFFANQTVATEFSEENGGSVVEYTDGYCYWDIFLGKNPVNVEINKWDVLRNDYYKCNITNIIAPGRNSADIPVADADYNPDRAASISTNIIVQSWNSTPTDYELE